MSKNLLTRTAVAAVAIPIIIWISYSGGWWLLGMVALFALVGIVEFLVAEGFRPAGVPFWVGILLIAGIFYGIAVRTAEGGAVELTSLSLSATVCLLITGLFLVAGMLFAVGKESPDLLFARYTRLIWGVLYIGMLYPFVFLLGETTYELGATPFSGGDCLLFLFALLWVGDTAAMGFGSWIGRHALAPAVSPRKTVEGLIGGLLGAVVIGVLMIFWKFKGVPWYHVLIMAFGCSVFGQLGDLVESMWKRSLGIKDSSSVIPGHGGVLDRFDSLLFAAPFMYCYLSFFVV